MIKEERGDICDADEEYIVHQCNTTSSHVGGLAATMNRVFPYANPLLHRTKPPVPGTIEVYGDGRRDRKIITLFGQVFPGSPRPGVKIDTASRRLQYFKHALEEIADLRPSSLAFPKYIGCGIGGGDWKKYLALIEKFKRDNPDCEIKLYYL